MDARELTQKYYDLSNRVSQLEKTVEFLEQEFQKQRMKVDDMSYDVKDLQMMRRIKTDGKKSTL